MDAKVSIPIRKFLDVLTVAGTGSIAGFVDADHPIDPNNPFGPYGPGTPIVRLLEQLIRTQQAREIALSGNPTIDIGPLPARSIHYEPGHFAVLTRKAIQDLIAQHQLAGVISGTDQNPDATKVTANRIAAMAERICGNEPKVVNIVFPPPQPGGGGDPYPITPLTMLAAAVQFDLAARGLEKHVLQPYLVKAAEQIVVTAMERFDRPE